MHPVPMQPAAAAAGGASASSGGQELVQLSVGGRPFSTTRTTLCNQGGMLAAMFGGEMEQTLLRDQSGRYFLDRDGAHFGTVLNFLRDGHAVLPADRQQLEQLRAEAAFYNLEGLAAAVDAALAEDRGAAAPLPKDVQSDIQPIQRDLQAEMKLCKNKYGDIRSPNEEKLHSSRMEVLKMCMECVKIKLQLH